MTVHDAHKRSYAGPLIGLFRASRPLRFLIVGGLNTALCYAVFALLIWAALPVWLANLGAVTFGIVVSFFTQGRIVFGDSDPRRIVRFVASWMIIYLIQTALIMALVRWGLAATLAGLIVLPGAAVASYFVQKFVVFRTPNPRSEIA